MKRGAKLIVKGTVQGVFFRQFCLSHAKELSLTGFARNLESGDVEIVIEGDHEAIAKFTEAVKQGPQHSQIRNVSVEEKQWSGDFKDFRIIKF